MQENFISRAALFALLLWIVTALLLGAVWGLAFTDVSGRWSRPLAVMACVSACGAVASQGRVHVLRMCAVVRATAGIEPLERSGQVHSLR